MELKEVPTQEVELTRDTIRRLNTLASEEDHHYDDVVEKLIEQYQTSISISEVIDRLASSGGTELIEMAVLNQDGSWDPKPSTARPVLPLHFIVHTLDDVDEILTDVDVVEIGNDYYEFDVTSSPYGRSRACLTVYDMLKSPSVTVEQGGEKVKKLLEQSPDNE